MRYHRPIPDDAEIKTCAVLHENGKWCAVISAVLPTVPRRRDIGKPVGVDVGLERYATLSNGELVTNLRLGLGG